LIQAFVLDVRLHALVLRGQDHAGIGRNARMGNGWERVACSVCLDLGDPERRFPRLHSLANSYQLTAYDVVYLDLAKRLSLPLATRDDDLKKAALAEGIEVLS
jgi:predicted nucleic acid-binding protein